MLYHAWSCWYDKQVKEHDCDRNLLLIVGDQMVNRFVSF